MFKINNKDTRANPMASFWCFCCYLWTYSTPCSSVFIVNFEQINAGCVRWSDVPLALSNLAVYTSPDLYTYSTLKNTINWYLCAFFYQFFFSSDYSYPKVHPIAETSTITIYITLCTRSQPVTGPSPRGLFVHQRQFLTQICHPSTLPRVPNGPKCRDLGSEVLPSHLRIQSHVDR